MSSVSGMGSIPGGIRPPVPPRLPAFPGRTEAGEESASFGGIMMNALSQVNDLELAADRATRDLAVGKTDDVVGAILAAEKAQLAMSAALTLRKQALEAYEQIMRMPV
ncbi:MAG: flagellar hook-basal body complex protein FliE [Bacillota bacterium]